MIFFDLGNVLVKFDPQIAVKKFESLFGVSKESLWHAMFVSDIERDYTVGKISSLEFHSRVCHYFKKSVDYKIFSDIWNDIFWLNEGMEELVSKLAARYPLYLISNTNELHFEFIKKHYPILKHFRKHFPSHEVGARKPEPAIFRHALKEAQVRAEEAVFIDDIADFVEAAKNVGMRGIQFQSRHLLEEDLRKVGFTF